MRLYPALDITWSSSSEAADDEQAGLVMAAVDDESPTAVEPVTHGLRIFFTTPMSRGRAALKVAEADLPVTCSAVNVSDEDWAERSQAWVDRQMGKVQAALAAMSRGLGERNWCAGTHFSLADIAVVPHLMGATFLGFPVDGARHPKLVQWMERVQERPAVARDNVDVFQALQRLQQAGEPAFDPYRVQWRSERLEWVVKHGFADWFAQEMRAGRAFFPLV